jgi:hypothetical protein
MNPDKGFWAYVGAGIILTIFMWVWRSGDKHSKPSADDEARKDSARSTRPGRGSASSES